MAGFGYSSTRSFDLLSLWGSAPSLPTIATKLYTQTLPSAGRYDRIGLVGHSVGGLVVQQAIVEHEDLRKRVSHVVLFGTPSNGVARAQIAGLLFKQRLSELYTGDPFITSLRKAWDDKNLSTTGGFKFLSVAGEKDQFVPPASSLQCFPASAWRVIPGNHLTMLEGDTVDAPAVQILLAAFEGEAERPEGAESTAKVTIDEPARRPPATRKDFEAVPQTDKRIPHEASVDEPNSPVLLSMSPGTFYEKEVYTDIIQRLWPEYLTDRNAALPELNDSGAGQLVMALARRGDPETAINLLSAHAKTREVRIFLASSSELREDRDEFDLYFRQQNDQFRKKALYLKIVRWEDFLDAMSETRLQDEYNSAIRKCDVFVALFFTKTGKFTEEEFDVAHRQFQTTKKPLIYTFFKSADINVGSARKVDLNSLWAFQEKLGKLGHYWTDYKNIDQLKLKFGNQIDRILEKLERAN